MRNLTLVTTAIVLFLSGAGTLRADDAADAQAIVDKAIKAMGGADKLKKAVATSSKLKGKLSAMGREIDLHVTTYTQEPDRVREEVDLAIAGQNIKIVEVFNKDKGWIVTGDVKMDMTADVITAFKERLYVTEVGRLVTLRDKEFKLSTTGETKVDGKDTVGVRVERKGRPDVTMYFDKKSHFPVKTEGRFKDAESGGEANVESFMSDYKEVEGLMQPQKIKMLRDGKEFLSGDVSDQKFEEKLSDTLFEKP